MDENDCDEHDGEDLTGIVTIFYSGLAAQDAGLSK